MSQSDSALLLHQWVSPGFPVGAFAYSHGLETAVAEGLITDGASAEHWIGTCLTHGAGTNDAILMSAAWQIGRAKPVGAVALVALAHLADALAPSVERRLESNAMGAAFSISVNSLHGISWPSDAVWDGDVSPFAAMPYPVAFGFSAGVIGADLALGLRLFLQAFVANLASAAVRLVPLGQTEGQRIILALAPAIETAAQAATPGDVDDIGSAGFAVDVASMRHEILPTRLFRS